MTSSELLPTLPGTCSASGDRALNAVRPDDLPVEVFDTTEVRIVPVAASFESWIEWFVENVQTAESSKDG